MARKTTKREVHKALGAILALYYHDVTPVSDSVILLNVNGADFRITVSIPRALHGRGGPKKRAGKPEDTNG
jgi:hypothetical protein